MKGNSRLRQLTSFGFIALAALALAACAGEYPNTTFEPRSEFARSIDFLWDRLLLLGTIVFVLVELALIYVIFRYRRRPNDDTTPPQTHGNALLEVTWTLIPAVILIFIAVPTVRVIFETQSKVAAGALEIEVIGHQWWWEFKYPEYNIVTANEIYLPVGRTVNFKLTSADVIHSFWVPQLAGKRDVVTNRTNYIWFTPDSTLGPSVWNGFCTEYCGASHANMRFRVFTVRPEQFESWVAGQKQPAAFGAVAAAAGSVVPGADSIPAPAPIGDGATAQLAAGYTFPEHQPEFAYARPNSALPRGLTFSKGLTGNAARGMQAYNTTACIGCHVITGNPMSVGVIGPNLTHFGSRSTIGAGSFPNTPAYLALWLKNTRAMKPGSIMPTMGANEYDPQLKRTVTTGGLDDQQIADIVAYLMSLK
ncbi:MAG: cytochrome c oxidase subunit II [Gemmatimonadaceae bacterium]